MPNYYEVLDVPVSSSHEELKRSYHNLAREHHPDKVGEKHNAHFHLINEAWKVLGDADKRRKYNAQLKAAESHSARPVQEEVKLSEIVHDAELGHYVKDCRCGGSYVLCEEEVCEDLLLVDCDNCSLSIVIDCEDGGKNKTGHS